MTEEGRSVLERRRVALRRFLRRGFRAVPVPYLGGNRIAILIDGAQYFTALIEAINGATRTVFVETYILVADTTGWRVAEALAAAAKRGAEVAICWDGYGSFTLDWRLPKFLHDAGVKILVFRPVSIIKGVWPWTKRNHRKSVIVDGRLGMVGGQNISDDYAAVEDGGRGWHDTAVRVEGPAVTQLESMFRRMWMRYGGAPLHTLPDPPPVFSDGHEARFLGNFARRDRAFIRRSYLVAIIHAERSIRICNAYFVPDRVLTRALIRAAKRGVNVEIMIGAATDVLAVLHVSRSLYEKFLKNGIRVYEWTDRVLHSKTAVIDGMWSTIGSMNLDALSFFGNLEVNAGIVGDRIGRQMDEQFQLDLERSQRIELEMWKKRSLLQRIAEWFFGMFRRIV